MLVLLLAITAITYKIIAKPAEISQINSGKILVGVRAFPGYPSQQHKVRNAHEMLLGGGQFLSPALDWSDRFPYYTVIRSSDTIDIHEDDQRVIDQELSLMATAGLDYVAIEQITSEDNIDGDISGYDYFLELYHSSPNKNQIKFALINTLTNLDQGNWKNSYLKPLVSQFQDTQYLRLANNQPVLFIRAFDRFVDKMGPDDAKKRLRQFINSVDDELGTKPYLVLMDQGSHDHYQLANDFYFNSRTDYLGKHTNCNDGSPYQVLAKETKEEWDSFSQSNLDYIPVVTLGIDPRPKMLDPEVFTFGNDPEWCQQGKPNELSQSVQDAIVWVQNNRKVTAKPNMVLIAAWNDLTESGWLVPTLSEGNARLNALSKVLGGQQTNVPPSPYRDNPPPAHDKGEITNLSLQDGDTLKANQPITISATAPMSARLEVILQGARNKRDYRFINGRGTRANRKFDVTLDSLPPGGPYTLTIKSFATNSQFNDVSFARVTDLQVK